MTSTRLIKSILVALAALVVGMAAANVSVAKANPTPAGATAMQQQLQTMAEDPANAAMAMHFRNAANAAGAAADALREDPSNKEKAAAELKGALRVLVDAAWQGADVALIARDIANALVDLGAMSERGFEQFQGVMALLAEAQRLSASSDFGSFQQSFAIRELVIGLHSIIDNGWHDFWHSTKALRWYIAAAGSGAYFPDFIDRLLAFVDAGDFSDEARARIAKMVADLVAGVKDGSIAGRDYIDAENRIRDAIRDESRRIGAERKRRHREEVAAEEAAERAAARASRYGPGDDVIIYHPTNYGPYIRDIDLDPEKWKAVLTPPIRPPEIVFQPAPPEGPVGAPAAAPTMPAGPLPSTPAATPPAQSPPIIGPEPVGPGPIGPEPMAPMPQGPPTPSGPPPPPPTSPMGPF